MKQSKNWVGSKFFLVKHKIIWLSIILMKRKYFGLTIADVMRLAYQLA
jgi:hypothetical protein